MSKNTEKLKGIIVPEEVTRVTETLKNGGFEAYLVGGCVRDIFLQKKPLDWDIATNAVPEDVQGLFPHTYYENEFGTVGIVNDKTDDKTLKSIEVTTYRIESVYSDSRHPDKVSFGKTIEEDLKRRDFTINAIAIDLNKLIKDISKGQAFSIKDMVGVIKDISKGQSAYREYVVDPYRGLGDIETKTIRTVLNPKDRFNEDALRIMRAIRLSVVLNFSIEKSTREAIKLLHMKLSFIAKERIRDEFIKIIMSPNPEYGLTELKNLNLIKYVIPEFEKSFNIEQGGVHVYDVWTHSLKSLQATSEKGFGLELRLAALFHDIAKPHTRRKGQYGKKEWTFYGHDVVGARVTRETLEGLKFPKETVDKVSTLVRNHMFFADTEQITHSAVRRIIRNVGKDNIWDLVNLRIADRIGNNRPKEEPYRLRKYKSMIEEVIRDPVSVTQLSIDGSRIMKVTHETPGPKIGYILNALLEEVLEDPTLNRAEYLEKRSVELSKIDDFKLIALAEKGKQEKEKREEEELNKIRLKNKVR